MKCKIEEENTYYPVTFVDSLLHISCPCARILFLQFKVFLLTNSLGAGESFMVHCRKAWIPVPMIHGPLQKGLDPCTYG